MTAPRCAHLLLRLLSLISCSGCMQDVCLIRGPKRLGTYVHTMSGSAVQALQTAVKGMARRYTGVDGRNRDEREKLYFERFRLVHKKARHRVSAEAASAGQPVAERGPQRAASGASHHLLICVHSPLYLD